jgi:Amt family ammonium transporter
MAAINTGDTAFMLVATALVMLMTPGLAFFYGGLVRKKNVLSILMQCFVMLCAISVQWILFGYSLSFGPDHGGIIGGLDWIGLRGVGAAPNPAYAAGIPHSLFMAFQMMFAIITPALMIGAFAERINFAGFLVFTLLWSTLVYDPMAHWVWGDGGWLKSLGALDFAGGTVVHINAGVAALIAVLLIGKRNGINTPRAPHNLPFCVLGAGLLWFGWFGFNAGSALAANGTATNAFITTNTSAAAAGLAWAALDWIFNRTPTMLGVVTGLVAGLVAITPAAGFVSPLSAMAIGAGASAVCFVFVTKVKARFGYDDTLDVFGVHGVGGIFGALATGIFAQESFGGVNGLLFGNPRQFLIQLLATGTSIVFTAVGTLALFKLTDLLVGIRVKADVENLGLDLAQHHESGYTVID